MTAVDHRPSGAVPLTRAHLPSLTGLRWVGALGVFFYHATGPFMFPDGVFDERIPFALRNVGALALSFFFILTGFVMTWSARPTDNARRFWLRRIVKLYPNYLVTFFVMLALLDFTDLWPNRQGATGVIPSLFMVQAWSPNPYTNIGVNAVSWSLSVDAFFLLLFPLFLIVMNRIRVSRLWFWFGVTAATMVAVPLIALLLPHEPMLPAALIGRPTSEWPWWLVYTSPLTRSLECVLGALAARLVLHGRWPKIDMRFALPVIAAIYVAGLALPINFYGIVVISAAPMIVVTAYLATRDMGDRPTIFAHPVMVWFGTISYAFYLLHRMILEVVVSGLMKHVTWSTPAAFGMIVLLLGVTILLGWALYSLVEHPLVRRFSPADPTARGGYFVPVRPPGGPPDADAGTELEPEPEPASRTSPTNAA
jgi:peptidoglycan/LPS O-acetylase OafA/YrhL